jgi:hypothetical protein
MRDLINNGREMYRKVLEANGKLDDIDHGLLVQRRMTLSEERLKECWTTLREVIADLRSFVETDDYSFIEMAKERVSALEDGEVVSELSGMRDLINNVREMYRKVLEANGKLDDIDHGLLVQQAIYSITRANILAVGIEFRLKRMRGG